MEKKMNAWQWPKAWLDIVKQKLQKIKGADLYHHVEPYALPCKVFLQMVGGGGLVILILLKLLHHVGLDIPFLAFFLKPYVYNIATLDMVGLALAYAAAIELAYTLFTDGPDEAVDPLITGVAAAILIGISKIDIAANLTGVLAIFVAVGILAGLFALKLIALEKVLRLKKEQQEAAEAMKRKGLLPLKPREENEVVAQPFAQHRRE